jgi:hypothetical protein
MFRFIISFIYFLLTSTCCIAQNNSITIQRADTTEWTVLLGGNKAGFLKKWKNADGSFTEWFQFNDRGRGDSTVTTYRYDKEGFYAFIEGKGIDYYKKPVEEKYRAEHEWAYWENNSEKGEKKLEGKANYVPLKINLSSSYQKYFTAAENTIKLLPTGQSKLTVLKELPLADRSKIRLISTVGFGLAPEYTWIDDNNDLFASLQGWLVIIRKGHEAMSSNLVSITDEQKAHYFEKLANKLAGKPDKGIIVTNARLFDSKTGKITPKATIVIENSIIKQVSNGKAAKAPEGYTVIDAKGRFVMPGLWDMHVHYQDGTGGLLHLSCGVTNIRDMGNTTLLVETKKRIDNQTELGPRIQVLSGFIDGAGPYAGPIGEKINSIEEGIAAVKKYADLGYEQIKLYSSLKPEWVKPLAEEAKKQNMRVSGHIPAHMLAVEAIMAGYNEIQHMNMLFLNFYGKELDTRTPVRFTAVGQRAAAFDFNSQEWKDFITLLKEKSVVIDPTVTIFEGRFMGEEGKTNTSYEPIAHLLPLDMQRRLKSSSSTTIPEGEEQTYRNSYGNMLKMIKLLYDNGIIIVPGTDAIPGFTLHRELENYVKAGIPNKEVLKIATITSAKVAGKDQHFGSIEKGKRADIIIIDGDPTQKIEDIRKVELVIKDNHIYKTKELSEALSIKHFK